MKTETRATVGTSVFCVSAVANPLSNSPPTFSLFRIFLLMWQYVLDLHSQVSVAGKATRVASVRSL